MVIQNTKSGAYFLIFIFQSQNMVELKYLYIVLQFSTHFTNFACHIDYLYLRFIQNLNRIIVYLQFIGVNIKRYY